ncbi:MAG TPA: FtsX-like permease family protein [Nitrospirota bacterium]|nr:FtsX-like permease family protein [Nitrospirota bacterium]
MQWFERQRNIIDFTLSSLLRRKGKNAALLVVYISVVFVLSSVMFFTHAIRREASLVLQGAPEIVVQRVIAGRHDLIPVGYAQKIVGIRGVRSAKVRLWGYYYDAVSGANYTLMAPDQFSHGEGAVAIGSGIAQSGSYEEGTIVPLKSYNGTLLSFEIKKILTGASELVNADLMLMAETDFRSLFGIGPSLATDIVVEVMNPREVATIAAKIVRLLPDTRPIIRDEILRTYDSVFNWRGGILLVIFFGGVLAFIIFAWDKASGLSAEEKREIGILKAIGWETSDIIVMKFWEGLSVSLAAFLGGITLGYLHVFFASSSLFEPVLKGWSVLYPDFRLVPFIDPLQVATLFMLTVMPYTVATVIPSWRAATVDPDVIMRS